MYNRTSTKLLDNVEETHRHTHAHAQSERPFERESLYLHSPSRTASAFRGRQAGRAFSFLKEFVAKGKTRLKVVNRLPASQVLRAFSCRSCFFVCFVLFRVLRAFSCTSCFFLSFVYFVCFVLFRVLRVSLMRLASVACLVCFLHFVCLLLLLFVCFCVCYACASSCVCFACFVSS